MHAAPKLDRRTVTKNIEAVLKLEEEDEQRLSALHRISHKVGWFVGTIYFVILQAAFVLVWVIWTSFVLIRQNSMDLQAERRNHLDLQINLLAEKEATSVLKALGEIAKRFDIDLSHDAETRELTKDTPVESIARDLRSKED